NDGRCTTTRVKAEFLQTSTKVRGIAPEVLTTLRFLLDNVQGRNDDGDRGWRHTRTKDQGAGMVFNVINDLETRRDKPTHGGKRFAEGTHADVDGMLQAKVLTSPSPIFAEHTNRMHVVHHQDCMVRLAEFRDLWQIGNAALHAKHAIDHHHLARLRTQALQDAFEVRHVVVAKFERFAKRLPTPIENTGMVEPIGNDKIPLPDQG